MNNLIIISQSTISEIKTINKKNTVQPFGILARLSFYLFLFSLPFESSLISGSFLGFSSSNSVWSLSRITGLIILIALLLSRKSIFCLRLPAVRWFIVYVFLYLIAALYTSFFSNYPLSSNLIVFPWLILIFIVCCEFFLDASLRNPGLKVLLVAISLCALLQVVDLAFNSSEPMLWSASEMRTSAFGQDPNFIGAQYSAGILIAILFILGILPSGRGIKLFSLFGLVVCTLTLIQTGSRSAVICLVIALLALFLNRQPARKRITIWLVSILSIGILAVLVISNAGFLSRFQDTLKYGDTTGRSDIYQASLSVFLASPMLGYPPGLNTAYVGYVMDVPHRADTHNTLLGVLTASGLVAFIPFFLGFVMCLIQAFRARNGQEDIAPLMLCTLAIVFCQTASWQTEKLFWILLAYGATAIMSKSQITRRKP